MIEVRNAFDQPLKHDARTYNNIWKDCNCPRRWWHKWLFARLSLLKKNCKIITIDSIKKQALNAGPETIHQINFFNDNLDRGRNTTIFFITEEAKETISDFSQETNEKVWVM